MFVLCVFVVALSTGPALSQKQHWATLREHIETLCVGSSICLTNETSEHGADEFHCCKDCSCDKNCGLQQHCCYPELDKFSIVDRKNQPCIVPIANYRQPQDGIPRNLAYHMVVDSYPNEKCVDGTNINTKCGSDESAATTFGGLFPVFSNKTGRIYKNIRCAECHGLNTYEVTLWEGYSFCKTVDTSSSVGISLDTNLQALIDGTLPPSCSVKFAYPGPQTDIRTEMCFTHAIQSCLLNNTFSIPPGLQMTHDEVREACYSDLLSAYVHSGIYANVFCYICSNEDLEGSPNNFCYGSPDDKGGVTGDEYSLMSLLAPKAGTQRKVSTLDSVRTKRTACRRSAKNNSDCRTVHCPSGQVLGDDGRCSHPDILSISRSVNVLLRLMPSTAVQADAIQSVFSDDPVSLLELLYGSSPWQIKNLSWRRSVVIYDKTSQHLVVMMTFNQLKIGLETAVWNVRQNIRKDWVFSVGNISVSLKQQFLEFRYILPFMAKPHAIFYMPAFDLTNRTFPSYLQNVSTYLAEVLEGSSQIDLPNSVINKMFYCDQISLKPEEYILDKASRTLYHLPSERIMFDNEFSLAFDRNVNDYIPRLCLTDTEYVKLLGNTAFVLQRIYVLISFVFINSRLIE